MPKASAEHVVVSEATSRSPLAAHARNIRLRSLIVQIAVGAVLATVVFVRLESATQFLMLAIAVAFLGVIAVAVGRLLGRDEAAKAGLWHKVFRAVSVEQDGKRRAHASASILVTDDGVAVRRRTSSRFSAATYATIVEVPWTAIERIEYSAGRFGWSYPVFSGPEAKIAAAGAVGTVFRDALQELGASLS
jgi:hypothetical protein